MKNQPISTATLTIGSKAQLTNTGGVIVQISGTCPGPLHADDLTVTVIQGTVSGVDPQPGQPANLVVCDGSQFTTSNTVTSSSGSFIRGKATVSASLVEGSNTVATAKRQVSIA